MHEEEGDGLFVEDEEVARVDSGSESAEFHEAFESQNPETEEDPIVDSIPIFLNGLHSPEKHTLHMLQYVGRPNYNKVIPPPASAQVKGKSSYIELTLPMDTENFYDKEKVQEWKSEINTQTLEGVLDKTQGALYAGQIQQDEEKGRRLVLIPIDSTSQLRPSFKYLDKIDEANHIQKSAEVSVDQQSSNVQILQTSAKPSTQPSSKDPFSGHNLGDAIRSVKRFEEERWIPMNWSPMELEETQKMKHELATLTNEKNLKNTTNSLEYLQNIIHNVEI